MRAGYVTNYVIPTTNHSQFHQVGGGRNPARLVVYYWVYYIKPIIKRFQSFLFILIFPIYKWALDFTVFGRTAWGFVCNLRAGYWHQWMSRVDMNRDSQVNYQASLCLHSAGYIMSWSVDPGIQSPCHDRDSVTVPVCAAKNIPGSQVGMLPEDRTNQAQPWFFGELLIITSC